MSTQRKVKEYVGDYLTESKISMKSIRERRLRDRKAYKGKRLKYKDISRRSD